MVARIIAVALSVVITGAPVITAVCQGVCAARANDGEGMGEHHSCHHQVPASNDVAITSAAHVCGHLDEGPSAIGQSLWSFATAALTVATFALLPPTADARQRGVFRAEHGPADTSPHQTQLRI
jgi:hypothetical protein